MPTPKEIAAAWDSQRQWAFSDKDSTCLLDLLNRVEALEQRAAAPQTAPVEDGEKLWEVMMAAYLTANGGGTAWQGYAAEIDAVAAWLAASGQHQAANMLRYEARRARGEA